MITTARFPVVLAAATLTAAALSMSPSAMAAPAGDTVGDPCAASRIAKTVSTVTSATGTYLEAHPETNAALTAIAADPDDPKSVAAVQAYFAKNPQAGKELQTIQQPLTTLADKCNLPIETPQLLGLMQAAQPPTATAGPDTRTATPVAAKPGLSIVAVPAAPARTATD